MGKARQARIDCMSTLRKVSEASGIVRYEVVAGDQLRAVEIDFTFADSPAPDFLQVDVEATPVSFNPATRTHRRI